MNRLNHGKLKLCLMMVTVLAFTLSAGLALAHGEKKPMKKGILLVAFGTSVPEAQVSFENIEKKVKAAYPDVPVRWAFTSHIIRKKLAKEGKKYDSTAMALAAMMEEGFTHVAVQSLHTIPGEEYHDLIRIAHAFKGMPGGMARILVGYPLLAKSDDVEKVVEAMVANIPAERKKDEAVVLMGHGTHHPGNAFYAAIQYSFWKKDPNIFVGTVEGTPSLDDVMADLDKKGIKKAWLVPFMSVAGDHAMNDMAGDEDDSWKSILTKAGVECKVVLKGTAQYDNVVDVWLGHLEAAMAHFK